MRLLTVDHKKMAKSAAYGYHSAILHLWPHKFPGEKWNTCPRASAGCASDCLNISGLGKTNKTQLARKNKTRLLFEDRDAFVGKLWVELKALAKRADALGLKPCVRLNGTSDIAWEGNSFAHIFLCFPDIQFYDYTKRAGRLFKRLPENYHLTFPLSENNILGASRVLDAGMSVAAVFRGGLPNEYMGREIVDGDKHDLTFLHSPGSLIGLRAKNRAKQNLTGFTIDVLDRRALDTLDREILRYLRKFGQFKTNAGDISGYLGEPKRIVFRKWRELKSMGFL